MRKRRRGWVENTMLEDVVEGGGFASCTKEFVFGKGFRRDIGRLGG